MNLQITIFFIKNPALAINGVDRKISVTYRLINDMQLFLKRKALDVVGGTKLPDLSQMRSNRCTSKGLST